MREVMVMQRIPETQKAMVMWRIPEMQETMAIREQSIML